ncbi:MAG: DNA primase DnaG [Candidatus Nanohaloarchaea archaeon]
MGKIAQDNVKYMIEAELDASGMIEKSDVIGAIFGQTEGLMGEQMDLRELNDRGKVGRMDVEVHDEDGSSTAKIKIPSSMDATDTALLAASLETIEQVGPSNADIRIEEIRDVRVNKRDYIVKRAKQLLEDLNDEKPDKQEMTDELKHEVREKEVTEFEGFVAGPDARTSDELIIVEGKADVLNLLKHGVKNCLGIGGTSVPPKIAEIAEERRLTAFLDGDRGGDLILKELKEKAEPEYVARAPEDKEVEELSKEQVHEALRDRSPVKYVDEPDVETELEDELRERFSELMKDLTGTRAANSVDEAGEILEKVPADRIGGLEQEAHSLLIDGELDGEAVEKAEEIGAEYAVGKSISDTVSSGQVRLLTQEEL